VVSRNVHILFDHDTLEEQTIDVSLNGLLVRAARMLAIGSPVSVRLFLTSGSQPITANGTVVRVAGSDKSVVLTEEDARLSKELFEKHFSVAS
jgi:hypothetical protein